MRTIQTEWVIVEPKHHYATTFEYKGDPNTKYDFLEVAVRVHEGHFQVRYHHEVKCENGSPPQQVTFQYELFPVKTGERISRTDGGSFTKRGSGEFVIGDIPDAPRRQRKPNVTPRFADNFEIYEMFLQYPRTSSGMQQFHERLEDEGVIAPNLNLLPENYRYNANCVDEILKSNIQGYKLEIVSKWHLKKQYHDSHTSQNYLETIAHHRPASPYTAKQIECLKGE